MHKSIKLNQRSFGSEELCSNQAEEGSLLSAIKIAPCDAKSVP
jgi:hypothetical protein